MNLAFTTRPSAVLNGPELVWLAQSGAPSAQDGREVPGVAEQSGSRRPVAVELGEHFEAEIESDYAVGGVCCGHQRGDGRVAKGGGDGVPGELRPWREAESPGAPCRLAL